MLKPKLKTRWTQEFKLRALARMETAPDVTALAQELGVQRELLYVWRRKFQAGGADALRPIGRPLNRDRCLDESPVPPVVTSEGAARRRIEELERKVGQQQLELDFFRAALRQVRERRPAKGGPGETPSTR